MKYKVCGKGIKEQEDKIYKEHKFIYFTKNRLILWKYFLCFKCVKFL